MGTFIFGTLGGLMVAGCVAIYARQALIEDARARTGGYF
jgi:hypothetical protein